MRELGSVPEMLHLHGGGGYTTVFTAQSSLNCTLKRDEFHSGLKIK